MRENGGEKIVLQVATSLEERYRFLLPNEKKAQEKARSSVSMSVDVEPSVEDEIEDVVEDVVEEEEVLEPEENGIEEEVDETSTTASRERVHSQEPPRHPPFASPSPFNFETTAPEVCTIPERGT